MKTQLLPDFQVVIGVPLMLYQNVCPGFAMNEDVAAIGQYLHFEQFIPCFLNILWDFRFWSFSTAS